MGEFNNILVLKWGALGDFIAGTVAIRALREHFPHARITLLSNKNGIEVAPAGSIVDVAIERKAFLKRYGIFGAVRALRAHRFDLAVNLKWSSEGAILLSRLAAPKVAGGRSHWLHRLYSYRPPEFAEGDYRHEYHKNLDIVEAIGVPAGSPRAYLHIGDDERAFARQWLEQHPATGPRLIIAPGASRPGKMWPAKRYASVGRRLVASYGGQVLVSWGPNDEGVAREVVAGIGRGAVMLPKTSIRQVGALMAVVDACLCNNSGMLHVAYALNKPVVCLNTAVSWMPYGPNSFAINAFATEHLMRCPGLGGQTHSRGLFDINVDEVWNTLSQWVIPRKGKSSDNQ